MTALDPIALSAALDQFARRHWGTGARVRESAPMAGGHAGLTYSLSIEPAPGAPLIEFVLRLAPPGVRRQGNTDVFRQAELLRVLHAAGLPVPGVPFAEPGEDTLGTPFIMMERLSGRSFFIWSPDRLFDLADAAVAPLWLQAAVALADVHQFDWRARLEHWEAPRALAEAVSRWDPVLAKSPEPAWIVRGRALADRLLATLPPSRFIGVVHGDFQPGNVLFHDGRLSGIVDWELAGIADQMLDLGWLMMMGDRQSWHPDWMPAAPLAPEALAARYAAGTGRPLAHLAWYRAWAGYSFAAISCMNLYLHRSGRRVDPAWERFALAIPALFARAEALLAHDAGQP